jgi:ATP-dependent DNA helicase RecQ
MQNEILDILTRMIDPALQSLEEEDFFLGREVKSRFSQLPWAVEYALIKYLYKKQPSWFAQNGEPESPLVTCVNAHFEPGCESDYLDAEPYYSGPSFLIEYLLSDSFLRDFFYAEADGSTRSVPKLVEEWMEKCGLYETADDNLDPHFAERAFVVNVLIPAYGLSVLPFVTPQKCFEQFSYQVDFFAETPAGHVVVEVDGREYHDPVKIGKDRFEYELKRQNYIQSLGYKVFRYPARRILKEPHSVIDEVKQNIPAIGTGQADLSFSSDSGENNHKEGFRTIDDIKLAKGYCKWFRPVQLGLLLALSNGRSIKRFRIVELNSPPGLAYLALIDLGILINQACKLYDVKMDIPQEVQISIGRDINNSDFYKNFLKHYFEAISFGPEGLNPVKNFIPFSLKSKGREEDTNVHLIIDLAREGRIPLLPDRQGFPDVLGFETANLATLRARMTTMSLERPGQRNSLRPQKPEKRLLDFFARRYLRIPSLYHHYDPLHPKTEQRQYELVRRVLEGESVLGIMPTGRGKSVAFQLSAMLLPGGVLVISPLRALMRDQLEDLRYSRGYNSVESIRYDMKGDVKERAIDDFLKGYTNLLYISPERLQEIKFSTTLAEAASSVHISLITIDEAHCVSEWGHDFRLSYLHIPLFLDGLKKMQDGILCPIVGLTATATPPVRRDVCAILGLSGRDAREGGNLVAESNIDRTELSFSVHLVEGNSYPEDRQKILYNVLTEILPRALDYNHRFSWHDFSKGAWKGKGAGTVFCIYAKPLGLTAWQDGVGAVRDNLLASGVIPDENMRIYASDSPRYCPICFKDGFYTYAIHNVPKRKQNEGKASLQCANNHYFSVPEYHKEWNDYISKTQHEFKAKAFPLLVSTKAYGMGIDHRGLRFIIHYGCSSSIESYYQEAGRAGRDEKHSHCALIVRLPDEKCLENFIEEATILDEKQEGISLPPCMGGDSFHKRVCPLGLPEPCDFSRQLRMVLDYYVKPEGFAKGCSELWAHLMHCDLDADGRVYKKECGGGIAGDKRLQRTQNHLFRLEQLGLIERFMLKYRPHSNHFDITFIISMNSTPKFGDLLMRLRSCLIQVWSAPDQDEGSVLNETNYRNRANKLLNEAFGQALFHPKKHDVPTIIQVETAVFTLFQEVRKYVLRMRLESLARLIRYVRSNNQCRRKELLGAMTGEEHGSDIYSCNFCNSSECVPDASFSQMKATPAPDSGQHRDIFAAEEDAFKSESLDLLDKPFEEAKSQKLVGAFGQHAVARLEFDPDNPAANLAAAKSYAKNPDPNLKRSAHRFFKQFSRTANLERKHSELAKRGYETYKEFDINEAIRSYARSDTAFDNIEFLSILDIDSDRANLSDEEQFALRSVRYIEQYNEAINSFTKDSELAQALSKW